MALLELREGHPLDCSIRLSPIGNVGCSRREPNALMALLPTLGSGKCRRDAFNRRLLGAPASWTPHFKATWRLSQEAQRCVCGGVGRGLRYMADRLQLTDAAARKILGSKQYRQLVAEAKAVCRFVSTASYALQLGAYDYFAFCPLSGLRYKTAAGIRP